MQRHGFDLYKILFSPRDFQQNLARGFDDRLARKRLLDRGATMQGEHGMSTLNQQDALDPKSLLYYAPRRLRDSANDMATIQPLPGENAQAGPEGFAGQRPSNDAAPLEDPVPDAFREGDGLARSHPGQRLQHLFEAERKSNSKTLVRQRRSLAFAIAASFAAAAGIAVGIVFLDAMKFSEGRDRMPFTKDGGKALAAPATTPAPTLAVEDSSGKVNELLSLGVKVSNYTPGATVSLSGLLKGTEMSTGAASGEGGWRIAVDDLPNTLVIPPRDYLGPMNILAELRGGNGQAIVRSPVRFLWTPPTTDHGKTARLQMPSATASPPTGAATPDAPRQIDPKEIAALLKRAEELVSVGDLPAARLLLLRIAEAHNARAAFDLGATYDPNVIKKLDGNSAVPDLALARAWYQRAQDWGLSDASKRLDALARVDQ
jgi:hypothetical protein